MKKIILSTLLICFAIGAFAQKKEMNSAIANYEKYLAMAQIKGNQAKSAEILVEAKTSSDKAILDEKTKVLPELWINRALILGASIAKDSTQVANVDENVTGVKDALAKAKELDTKAKNKKELEDAEKNILIYYTNGGAIAFNNKDFANAYKLFNQVSILNPTDTSAYVNAGVAARQANNYEGMISSFQKAISMNSKEAPSLYAELINTQLQVKKDTTAALKLLDEASAKYPENVDLVKTQAQIYINQGNEEKSMAIVDKLITKEPNNPIYQVIKGQTFLNKAYDLQKVRNTIPDKDKAKYKEVNDKMNGLIEQSLPFYLQALKLDDKNVSALEGLKIIYTFKNDDAKYNEIKAKLDGLKK